MFFLRKSPTKLLRNTALDTMLDVFTVLGANSYIRTMATGTVRTSSRERPDSRLRLYWLDIDVTFNDIMRQDRVIPRHQIARLPRSSLQYSILNGVGIVENALSVGNSDTTFNRFEVDVAAFVQTGETFEAAELNRSAKMIWNDVDVEAPRLEIYVQPKMLRHLVELYLTKRIDTVLMSMKIAITRQPIGSAIPVSDLPLLDRDGRLYFRRTQCELLSVQASLAHEHPSRRS
jgi:hypothetical protein